MAENNTKDEKMATHWWKLKLEDCRDCLPKKKGPRANTFELKYGPPNARRKEPKK